MAGYGRTTLGAALGIALSVAGLAWTGSAEAARRDPAAHPPRTHHAAKRHQQGRHHAQAPRTQTGKASVYSTRLSGRRMADGTRFDPGSNAVASKTLPLGTTARVTNLENGRTATVRVRDRGPHVRGRILDVSPKNARRLGIGEEGTAPVAVQPLTVPRQE